MLTKKFCTLKRTMLKLAAFFNGRWASNNCHRCIRCSYSNLNYLGAFLRPVRLRNHSIVFFFRLILQRIIDLNLEGNSNCKETAHFLNSHLQEMLKQLSFFVLKKHLNFGYSIWFIDLNAPHTIHTIHMHFRVGLKGKVTTIKILFTF